MAATQAPRQALNATSLELTTYNDPTTLDHERTPSVGVTRGPNTARPQSSKSKSPDHVERMPSSSGTEPAAERVSASMHEGNSPPSQGEAAGVDAESASRPPSPSFPPPDQGKTAWLVLGGSALLQAPVWGFPLAFGMIQAYLTENSGDFEGSPDQISSIGLTSQGTLYLSSPLTFYLLTHYPRLQRWCGAVGLAVAAVAYLASSFAKTFWQLILLQGIFAGLGTGLLFTSATLALDSWFLRRKGLAYGLMWAGKSLTGAGLPFLVNAILYRVGYRWMMRGWAVVLVILAAPLLPVFKPRIPNRPATQNSYPFLRYSAFWTLSAANILQGLGYFLPPTYLTLYCARLALPEYSGPLLLSLINGVSAPAGVIIGALNDRWGVGTVVGLCASGSALTVLLLWGLGSNFATLIAFSIGYGFFAGGYSSTWSGVVVAMNGGGSGSRAGGAGRAQATSDAPAPDASHSSHNSPSPPSLQASQEQEQAEQAQQAAQTSLLFGLLAGGRGLGNVLSGPLSAALLESSWGPESQQSIARIGGYATEYGPMILFTGVSALLGGWGVWGRCLDPRGRKGV